MPPSPPCFVAHHAIAPNVRDVRWSAFVTRRTRTRTRTRIRRDAVTLRRTRAPTITTTIAISSSSTQQQQQQQQQQDSLGLPPTLRSYVDLFASVPDPKLRYQQLLFLAKELPAMDPALKTDANRVHGCTSVVHVHVSLHAGQGAAKDKVIELQGDSDSQLTKGLLALLVNGLNGSPAAAVALIDPQFITYSGLSSSLTPSRNNGFVSMLAKIKQQVQQLCEHDTDAEVQGDGATQQRLDSRRPGQGLKKGKPMYNALVTKLSALKPTSLTVTDISHMHAGHAAARGLGDESHFQVALVADAFDGLSLVQRHRIIYTLMNSEMSSGQIHALQIDAKTPGEAA